MLCQSNSAWLVLILTLSKCFTTFQMLFSLMIYCLLPLKTILKLNTSSAVLLDQLELSSFLEVFSPAFQKYCQKWLHSFYIQHCSWACKLKCSAHFPSLPALHCSLPRAISQVPMHWHLYSLRQVYFSPRSGAWSASPENHNTAVSG